MPIPKTAIPGLIEMANSTPPRATQGEIDNARRLLEKENINWRKPSSDRKKYSDDDGPMEDKSWKNPFGKDDDEYVNRGTWFDRFKEAGDKGYHEFTMSQQEVEEFLKQFGSYKQPKKMRGTIDIRHVTDLLYMSIISNDYSTITVQHSLNQIVVVGDEGNVKDCIFRFEEGRDRFYAEIVKYVAKRTDLH